MAYTPAQWDKIQSTMPQEDRVSYIEYIKVADPTTYKKLSGDAFLSLKKDSFEPKTTTSVSAVEGAAQARALEREQKARQQAEIDYATKILPGGLTQAQIDSIAGAKTTAGLIGGTVDPKTGYVTSQYETPEQKAKREAEAARIAAEQKANADAAAKKLAEEKAAQAAAIAKAEAAAKAAAAKAALDATNAAAQSAAKAAADKAAADLAALLKQRAEIEATEKRIAELRAKIARGEDISNDDRAFLKLGPITASSATDTLGKQPGAGWIKSPDGKSWIKPTMPTETGFSFSWDDEKGWVRFKVGSNKTIKSTTYTGTGKDRKRIVTYNDDTTETFDDPESAGSKTITSTKYQGTGPNRKRIVTYDDNTSETFDDPEIVTDGDGTDGDGTDGDGAAGSAGDGTSGTGGKTFTQKDIDDAVAAALAKASETTADRDKKANALASLTSRFSQYGLESLIPKIRELVISGATEATISLELAETEEYKKRFKANADRLKKGLSVLDPGTYIGMEDSYRQALRAYGLKQFDTDDYVSQFISNDISANELSNRIVTAVQRVQNADPAITKQLKDFYNIGQNDLVAYVLDPNQQFQRIERQVQAAEIGVAAARQGINTGVQVAEQLAAQGVTQAEAQKGYATIADILPDAKKLSDIYGTTLEGYDLGQAEQEVFNQLASAQRRRQKLSAREIAQFSGQSGLSTKALTTDLTGQY
jgi:hypothetical protein